MILNYDNYNSKSHTLKISFNRYFPLNVPYFPADNYLAFVLTPAQSYLHCEFQQTLPN